MPSEKGIQEFPDQLLIAEILKFRDDTQIGIIGPNSGQRIDLDEIAAGRRRSSRMSVRPPSWQRKSPPGLKRHLTGGAGIGIVHRHDGKPALPFRFVLVAIAMTEKLFPRHDLEHTQHLGRFAGAGDADGEFPARQKASASTG